MPSSGTSNDEYIFAPGPSLPHAGQLFALNPSQRREELVEFVRHGLDLRLGGRMGDGQGQGFSQPSTTLRLRPQNSPIEGRARRARSNSTNPSGGHLRPANLGPTAPRSDSSQTDLQFRTRGQPKHQLPPAPVWPHGLGLIDAVQHLLPDPP